MEVKVPTAVAGAEAPPSPGTRRAADAVMEVDAWTVAYGDKQVLNAISFEVRRGEVLALIGPVRLRQDHAAAVAEPAARAGADGAPRRVIRLDGEDVYGPGMDANLLRRRVGMVFQQPNPFPMSIFENVAFAMREQARRRPRRSALEPHVEEALRRAGLVGRGRATRSADRRCRCRAASSSASASPARSRRGPRWC